MTTLKCLEGQRRQGYYLMNCTQRNGLLQLAEYTYLHPCCGELVGTSIVMEVTLINSWV